MRQECFSGSIERAKFQIGDIFSQGKTVGEAGLAAYRGASIFCHVPVAAHTAAGRAFKSGLG
jgi:hypothetical protein